MPTYRDQVIKLAVCCQNDDIAVAALATAHFQLSIQAYVEDHSALRVFDSIQSYRVRTAVCRSRRRFGVGAAG